MLVKAKKLTYWLIIAAPAGLLTWLAAAQTARVVTPNELVNAGGDGTEWLTYGHDYAETHFSPVLSRGDAKRGQATKSLKPGGGYAARTEFVAASRSDRDVPSTIAFEGHAGMPLGAQPLNHLPKPYHLAGRHKPCRKYCGAASMRLSPPAQGFPGSASRLRSPAV
jgi:hypothetical protein